MGLFDFLKKPKKKVPEEAEEAAEEEGPSKHAEETCSVCDSQGADKKWLGQYFHKKCLRKMRKVGKGMV